jgi:NitT/TauT family transport system permease protein
MAVDARDLDRDLAGLDALEAHGVEKRSLWVRTWAALWPKLAAILLVLAFWQVVVWSHWRSTYVLAPPGPVLREFFSLLGKPLFRTAVWNTMQRAIVGYSLAIAVGGVLGLAVARVRVLRTAVGSLITGLQTMPSIAWFPLAVILFKLSEGAILFVVVLGAAPSIANGIISGVDHVPPLLVRAGRSMGARGFSLYRSVVLPAALPATVAGLKQGWAFAWRSLMAGELLGIIASKASVGQQLQNSREFSDAPGLMAWMLVILVIGMVVDSLFGRADAALRRRWGLIDPATT